MVDTEYILKVGPTRLADVGIRERKETRMTQAFAWATEWALLPFIEIPTEKERTF